MTYRKAAEIKLTLIDTLLVVADDRLVKHGFSRRPKSFEYVRKYSEIRQLLPFYAAYRPHWDIEAHLLPQFVLASPAVKKKELELLDGNANLCSAIGAITRNQITRFADKTSGFPFDVGHWYVEKAADFPRCVSLAVDLLEHRVIPWLNELTDLQSIIDAHRRGDTRIDFGLFHTLALVSIFAVKGQMDDARQLVRKEFSPKAIRIQYAALFKNLDVDE